MFFIVTPHGGASGRLEFKTSHHELDLEKLERGKTFEIRSLLKKPFAITNRSNAPQLFRFKSIFTNQHLLKKKTGFEIPPDVHWLTFEQEELRLEPGETKEVNMRFETPPHPRFAGKKYGFLIKVTMLSGDFPTQSIPVYVSLK